MKYPKKARVTRFSDSSNEVSLSLQTWHVYFSVHHPTTHQQIFSSSIHLFTPKLLHLTPNPYLFLPLLPQHYNKYQHRLIINTSKPATQNVLRTTHTHNPPQRAPFSQLHGPTQRLRRRPALPPLQKPHHARTAQALVSSRRGHPDSEDYPPYSLCF